jgi:hypothetical protein
MAMEPPATNSRWLFFWTLRNSIAANRGPRAPGQDGQTAVGTLLEVPPAAGM